MPPTSSGTRRDCVVSVNGGPVTVQVLASRNLQAGGHARLYRGSANAWRLLEEVEIRAGAHSPSPTPFAAESSALDGCRVVVDLNVCALDPVDRQGTVQMHVLQDGILCGMTKPASYTSGDDDPWPPCNLDQVDPLTIRFTFLAR